MGRGLMILALLAIVAASFWYYNQEHKISPQLPETGTINAQTLPWTEYIAPLGQFKVLLPTHPHHSREARNEKNYEIFLAPKDEGTLYSINLITFPEKEGKDLEKSLNDMLKSNPKNLIKEMRKGKFNNDNAYDFTVSSQGTQISGKAFLVGNTLYVLSATTQDGASNPQEFDFFIRSFQLQNPPAAVPTQ